MEPRARATDEALEDMRKRIAASRNRKPRPQASHRYPSCGGELAGRDLVVLSEDYFDPQKVSDEGIKKLKSVLTVVDGRIVHNALR